MATSNNNGGRLVAIELDILSPEFSQEVRSALEGMGINDFMESAIMCHQKGQVMMFRGATFMANIVEKVKLEIIAADDSVSRIVEAIGAIARTGRKEDCRIAILPYLEMS